MKESPVFEFIPVPPKMYAEISQQVNMKFCFADVIKNGSTIKVKQIHDWILCRDFLGDALYAQARKITYSIYSFTFNGAKETVPTDKTYLLIKYNDFSKLEAFLPTMHHFEKKVRWARSKIIDIGVQNIVLVEASKKWVSSPQLISMYTLLWRLSAVSRNEGEEVIDFISRCAKKTDNDGKYLKIIEQAQVKMGLPLHPFYLVMKHNSKVFKDAYAGEGSTHWVHYNNGIMSFMQLASDLKASDSNNHFGKKTALLFKKEAIKKVAVKKKTVKAT